jgi:hypothetical protein
MEREAEMQFRPQMLAALQRKVDEAASTRNARMKCFNQVLAQPGAHDSDYRHSGYCRGHVVPAADVASSQQAVSDSFLLSNVLPQNSSLNSGKLRLSEKPSADWASMPVSLSCSLARFSTVKRIGVNRVAVPLWLGPVRDLGGRGGAANRPRLLRGASGGASAFAGIPGPEASLRW